VASRATGEADKVERRRVIANNREWDSASTVRRDWLKGFLARRTAPRNAMTYIAVTLARAGHDVRRAMESGHPSACELLSLTPAGSPFHGRPNPIAEAAVTATASRATMLTLAVLLGAAEDATHRQTWRNPSVDHRAYFTALRDWGYPLSTVEQLVLDDAGDASGPTAPDVDQAAPSAEEAGDVEVPDPGQAGDGPGDTAGQMPAAETTPDADATA
jgi:ParB family chromosome partitioning protein